MASGAAAPAAPGPTFLAASRARGQTANRGRSWSALVGLDGVLPAHCRDVFRFLCRRRRVTLAGLGHEALDRVLQGALDGALEHVDAQRRVELELETARRNAHV